MWPSTNNLAASTVSSSTDAENFFICFGFIFGHTKALAGGAECSTLRSPVR
jgi:hypothetical protein